MKGKTLTELGRQRRSTARYSGKAEPAAIESAFYAAFRGQVCSLEDCRLFVDYLYDTYSSEIFLYVCRQLQKSAGRLEQQSLRESAMDLCQDTFLRAFEWLTKNAGTKREWHTRNWLYTIAKNLVIDISRKAARRPLQPILVDLDKLSNHRTDRGPDQALLLTELRQKLEECIDKLTPLRRQALELVDVEGLEEKEVSSRLNVDVNTLRKRLFDARKEVRDRMDVYLLDPIMNGELA